MINRLSKDPIKNTLDFFTKCFGSVDGVAIYQAPGRTVLMGDHTDYNNGLVLSMTLNRGVYFACRPRTDSIFRIYSHYAGGSIEIDTNIPQLDKVSPWKKYIGGIISSLGECSDLSIGLDGALWGNIPVGCGVSSSSACLCSIALAINDILDLEMPRKTLAERCQIAENKYVGVKSGIMDPFISLHGRRKSALLLDCKDMSWRHIDMPSKDYVYIVINSRRSRLLGETGFMPIVEACSRVTKFLNRRDPSILSLRDVSLAALNSVENYLASEDLAIARHNILENNRAIATVEAYEKADFDTIGSLMRQSHMSLKDGLKIGVEETEFLVDVSQSLPQVVGSRLTGGGFGGCILSLVKVDGIEDFFLTVSRSFEKRFSIKPEFLILDDNITATRL